MDFVCLGCPAPVAHLYLHECGARARHWQVRMPACCLLLSRAPRKHIGSRFTFLPNLCTRTHTGTLVGRCIPRSRTRNPIRIEIERAKRARKKYCAHRRHNKRTMPVKRISANFSGPRRVIIASPFPIMRTSHFSSRPTSRQRASFFLT